MTDHADPPTRRQLLNSNVAGTFLWDFGSRYYVDLGPSLGTWIYSDPTSGGNNTLCSYSGTYSSFCSQYWEGFTCQDQGVDLLSERVNELTLIVYESRL